MSDSLRHQAVKGVVWSAVERFSVQGIQFILSIIIARLVAPSEYGLIAMLGIFLAIAQTFIDSGFSNALIQKKNRTEKDFSTVFYFNIVIAVIVYLILFLSSPYIAAFYNESQLELITKWIGLNLIVSSFSIVQRAKLTIQLDFKTQAKASLIAVVLSGIVGVILAYRGFGVWALVTQALLNNILDTVLLWGYAKWFPSLMFSYSSFRILFSFGSKLLLSGLLHTVYINLYSLIIGKRYSATDVGYYNRAYSLAQFPSINLVGIITRAIYPIQCEVQEDEEKLNSSFILYLRMSCYIIFPLMIGLAVLAKPLVIVLLTEKWLPITTLLSILCIAYMWFPLMVLNNQLLTVKGRSDYFLKAEIIKKVVAILILLFTMPFGLEILCYGILLYNLLDYLIIVFFVKRVINTTYWTQIKNIAPILFLNLCMGGSVFLFIGFFDNVWMKLFGGIGFGLLFYIGSSKLFGCEEFAYICSTINKLR